MEISKKILKTINKFSMFKSGDSVLVALSGGADSVCLLLNLIELKDLFNLKIEAAHVNHMLRGKAAQRDMNFVKELCGKLGIRLYILEKDIKEYSEKNHLSCEDAGRRVRYEFFKSINSDKIATAHTKDDNCENFFISSLRGTKIMGIPPVRGNIIRPLISVTKKEIYSYLKEKNQTFCVDKTNFSDDFFRNKVRLKLIPYINKKFRTDISEALENNLDVMYEENCFLDKEAEKFLQKCENKKDKIVIKLQEFNSLHTALKRRILRKIYYNISYSGYISYTHTESIINLALSMKTGKKLTLCDSIVAEISYESLIIRKERKKEEYSYTVKLENPCEISEAEISIMLSTKKTCKYFFISNDEQFTVRNRKNGDKLLLINGHHKKLSDFFTDKKIPQETRNMLPVIVDSDGICAVDTAYLRKEKTENEMNKVYIHIERTK